MRTSNDVWWGEETNILFFHHLVTSREANALEWETSSTGRSACNVDKQVVEQQQKCLCLFSCYIVFFKKNYTVYSSVLPHCSKP